MTAAAPRIVELFADAPEFQDCFALRLEVFVTEQNVDVAEEQDGQDGRALHFLAYDGDAPAGTARVLFLDGGNAKITRVAVRRDLRGRGIGLALMRAIETSDRLLHAGGFVLDAQVRAAAFYERLGYAATGDRFMEAGILHQRMVKSRGRSRPSKSGGAPSSNR